MKSPKSSIALFALALFGLSACTDKDREMVHRTKDGTEDFKYVPPKTTEKSGTAPASSNSQPAGRVVKPTSHIGDETASFVYKPDPRLSKQLSTNEKK